MHLELHAPNSLNGTRFLGLSRFEVFRDPTTSRFSRSPYKGNETSHF